MKNKKIQSPIHYKSFSGKFEAPTFESRKVSGYFAAFNVVDSDMDIIRPGAFAKSIQERGPQSQGNRKIKFLHQHNISEIAGPLMKLFEDSYGLGFEGEIEKTALGDIILERYTNGTYNEHSFGFRYVWDKCEWIQIPITDLPIGMNVDPENGETVNVFDCKELNLFEGSVVTFGANSQTPFTGFKGSKEDAIKMLNDELEYLIRKSPSYEFELQIRQLFQKQFSLVDSLAADRTKEEGKPKKQKGVDYNYLLTNLKL